MFCASSAAHAQQTALPRVAHVDRQSEGDAGGVYLDKSFDGMALLTSGPVLFVVGKLDELGLGWSTTIFRNGDRFAPIVLDVLGASAVTIPPERGASLLVKTVRGVPTLVVTMQ